MTGSSKRIIVGLCALALMLFCLIGIGLRSLVLTAVATNSPILISPGHYAPYFALPDQSGRIHTLKDYSGRPIVLAFLDSKSESYLPVLRSLRDTMPEFDKTGAKVFAVASDSLETNTAVHGRENLNFPIVSDFDATVAATYGAVGENHKIRNACIVIDETSRVVIAIPVEAAHHTQIGWQLLNMAACCLNPAATPAIVRVGNHVEDFRLPDATTGTLISSQPGKDTRLTVIEFLSSKCPCSLGYDARIKALAEEYSQRGVRFLGVNSSVDETAQEHSEHKSKAALPFTILMDNGGHVADLMQAHVTPEIFVLDSRNVVRYHGRIDDSRDQAAVKSQDLRIALDSLLAGNSPIHGECQSIGCAIMRAEPSVSRKGP